ncbi:MAG: hypothetical protein WC849_00315 [Candidatus Paceibacterota bacterium]
MKTDWLTKKITVNETKIEKFANRWFFILEWLIILGLLMYLQVTNKSWYLYPITFLSYAVFSLYIHSLFYSSSLYKYLIKKLNISSVLGSLVIILVSILIGVLVGIITSDIAISYIK